MFPTAAALAAIVITMMSMAVDSTLPAISVNVLVTALMPLEATAEAAMATVVATVLAKVTVLSKATAVMAKMTTAMAGEARATAAMEDALLVASVASEVDLAADRPVAVSEAMVVVMVEAIVTATIVAMVVVMEVDSAEEAAKDAEVFPSTECVHHKSNLGTNLQIRTNKRLKITRA